ncbi:MAG: winged helix-turn-helix domain-containing protein [Candidatus Azobacteroides sp.]|nr:winged helix-turn-helix domain-containing protein [Candidatus Azobacteroides sp.]
MKEKIGTNAGLAWNALNGKGEINLKDLKKETKLSEKDLYAALGWLAREEKINIIEKDKEIFVSII